MTTVKDQKNQKNQQNAARAGTSHSQKQDDNISMISTSRRRESVFRERRKPPPKRPFWVTKAMAEVFGREEILRATLQDTIIFLVFLVLITIYALEIRRSVAFYLTKGLTQQFVEREFTTLNGVDITFRDIRTAADFWHYLENHLTGSFFWEATYGEQDRQPFMNENDMNILYENKVLGVPRIRQVKVHNETCDVHEYFRRLFLSCYDQYSEAEKDTKPFGSKTAPAWTYSDDSITKSLPYWGKVTTYGGGGYYTDFTMQKNTTDALINDLKKNLWITRGTRAVFVDFSIYNANENLFSICKLIFEFPTTGGVLPSAEINTVSLTSSQDYFSSVITYSEYGVYVFLVFYFLEATRELVYFKFKIFTMFWSYIDWCIIFCLISQASFTIKRKREIVPAIELIKNNPDKYGNLENFAYMKRQRNNIFVVTLFFVYVKIFKFLNFNKTMGQLNNTLKKCALDILGFSLMFFIIYFAFAEVGYLLFGSQVEDYSSFGTAMFSLLRTILGDFNYAEIEQANRVLAPVYFLSYIFLVFFVLLNMFLAIINDSYADVKTEIAIAPDEMQMTEYISRGFYNMLRKCGCVSAETQEMKRELNVTIRKIREALTKCGFSDLEIEMFFARYNIDPLAEVGAVDVEKLLKELEEILGTSPSQEALGAYVHVRDFIAQQERLEQIDRTIGSLVDQIKSLLLKLDQMDTVKKVRQMK